jgi:FdrA protein
MMGTETNVRLLRDAGYEIKEDVLPSDLLIALDTELENAVPLLEEKMQELEEAQKKTETADEVYPHTLNRAMQVFPDANLVLISTPGEYAFREAQTALMNGKHVMLFSDNVTLEEEIELKKLGAEKGLLVMGPDCGTAIINGYPLAFANVVPQGNIGIVGASGTGIQEVSSLIARWGGGITQAIGTGGRDLKEDVGGIMMKMALKALIQDENTEVIVLISKPPAKTVASEIVSMCKNTSKKVVINFLGIKNENEGNLYYASNLTEAALLALELSNKKADLPSFQSENITWNKNDYFVALYTGGTLTSEFLLNFSDFPVYSNIHFDTKYKLKKYNPQDRFNKVIDLGEDEFTRGRPHPMIDPTLRNEFIIEEARNGAKCIILDYVLGYGSHLDPVGESIPALKEALALNPKLQILASITGTYEDPQDYKLQKEKLLQVPNVHFFETNQLLAENFKKVILSKQGEMENEE